MKSNKIISERSQSCWRRNLSCAWLGSETDVSARIVESRVLFLVETFGTWTCFSFWARATSFWVGIFFWAMVTFSCLPAEMEICQTFSWVGSCLLSAESLTFSSAAILSCAWAEAIFSLAAVWAPTLGPRSPPARQSGRRPCDAEPSWRPQRSRTRYRQTLGEQGSQNYKRTERWH